MQVVDLMGTFSESGRVNEFTGEEDNKQVLNSASNVVDLSESQMFLRTLTLKAPRNQKQERPLKNQHPKKKNLLKML